MITIYPADASDFTGLGLGALSPTECTIEERAGGMYELQMTHPMDVGGKWWNIDMWRILRAPAPVRETPLVEMGHALTAVTRRIYRVNVNTHLRLRTEPSTETGKIIGRYRDGVEVVRIGEDGDWLQVIVREGGQVGWMHGDYLEYVGEETDVIEGDAPGQVIQPRQTREQLFRITAVERDDAARLVHVTAQHIFYDLTGNLVGDIYAPENVPASAVVPELFARALNEHDFRVYCTETGNVSGEYTLKSLVAALLEKEIGVVPQTGARLIRDNYDVFVLADEVRDRGVQIRHGKNLVGAVLRTEMDSIVNRIVPVGRKKDGEPLYLENKAVVDSPRMAQFALVRAQQMEYDVQVGDGEGEFATADEARAELVRLAEAEFERSIDVPVASLEVDFVALEQTEEYARYADLQAIHLYDTVRVISPEAGIDASVRMTGYVWDALRQRYDSVTLGDLQAVDTVAYGYDIAEGTLSGTKVINGTLSGGKLADASVQYAKIAVAAVEQLAANGITAVRAHIGELAAGSVTTDQLYADLAKIAVAQITTANIENANIDWAAVGTLTAEVAKISQAEISEATIATAQVQNLNALVAEIADARMQKAQITSAQITDLNAVVAELLTANIGNAEIGFVQIRDLVADEAIITQGEAGQLYIARLTVTEANMVGLTVGELLLKNADGEFVRLVVDADGNVTGEKVLVEGGNIAESTISGGNLIENTITARELNVAQIFADEATVRAIKAANIDVADLFAQQAFISELDSYVVSASVIQALQQELNVWADERIALVAGRRFVAANLLPDSNVNTLAAIAAPHGRWISGSEHAASCSAGFIAVSDAPAAGIRCGVQFAVTAAFEGQRELTWYYDGALDLTAGEDYTLSCYVRTDDTDSGVRLTMGAGDERQYVTPTAEWVQHYLTFTAVEGGMTAFFGMDGGAVGSAQMCGFQLEYGAVVSAWSPHPADAAAQVKTSSILIDDDGIDISTGGGLNITAGAELAIDSGGFAVATTDFSLSLTQAESEEGVPVIDVDDDSGSGTYGHTSFLGVHAPNLREAVFDSLDVTLSEIGGWKGLENLLRETDARSIRCTVDAEESSYIVSFANYNGRLLLECGGYVVPRMFFTDTFCGSAIINDAVFRGSYRAVTAYSGSIVLVRCWMTNTFDQGVVAWNNADVRWVYPTATIPGWGCACSECFATAVLGARFSYAGYIPDGGVTQNYGFIEQGAEGSVIYGRTGAETNTVAPLCTEFEANLGWYSTWQGWNAGAMYQGYTGGKGRCYGCMQFDLSALSGKTLKKATLTLHRVAGVGKGSEIDLTLYGSATAWGSRPSLSSQLAHAGDAVSGGQYVTLDVTAGMSFLQSSFFTQLVLYTGETAVRSGKTYSAEYGKFDRAVLTVTYE